MADSLINRLIGSIDRVSGFFGQVASLMTLLACVISAGNAVMRYLFNSSSNAWIEMQWYMFGAIVLLGASHTLKLNEHVRVDIIYSAVSPRARLLLDLAGILIILLPMSIYLAWLCWPMFWISLVGGETSANPGGLLRWPVKLLFPLCFTLLALQGISEAIKRVLMLQGKLPVTIQYEKSLQ